MPATSYCYLLLATASYHSLTQPPTDLQIYVSTCQPASLASPTYVTAYPRRVTNNDLSPSGRVSRQNRFLRLAFINERMSKWYGSQLTASSAIKNPTRKPHKFLQRRHARDSLGHSLRVAFWPLLLPPNSSGFWDPILKKSAWKWLMCLGLAPILEVNKTLNAKFGNAKTYKTHDGSTSQSMCACEFAPHTEKGLISKKKKKQHGPSSFSVLTRQARKENKTWHH